MPDPPDQPPIPDTLAATITCVYCRTVGAVRTEWRGQLTARPLGTFSLAGTGMNISAHQVWQPWAVCRTDLGGCGHESQGRRDA